MSRAESNIEALLLPLEPSDFYGEPVDRLEFDIVCNGILGDERHNGNYRHADVRAPAFNKKKDLVINRQSVSVVVGTDLDCIAEDLGLEPDRIMEAVGNDVLDPQSATRLFMAQCLGANILLDQVQLDKLEPRDPFSVIDFGPYDGETRKFTDAVVQITRPNGPCIWPGKKIEAHYPGAGSDLAKQFVNVAKGRRGFVGNVVKPGYMDKDQSVSFVVFGER